MTEVKGKFDVQIDSNHRWDEDRVMEIDAYPLIQNDDGTTDTDTLNTLASVRIPALDICMDTWIASTESDEISELPPVVKEAYHSVVALATAVQKEMAKA